MQSNSTPVLPQTKTCTKCGEAQPLERFYISKQGVVYSQCRPCKAQMAARRRKSDPAHETELTRRFYARHRAEKSLKAKAYYAENREARIAYSRRYRAENPEKHAASALRWRQAHPARVAEIHRLWLSKNVGRAREAMRRWRSEHQAHLREYGLRYYAGHREQAREKARAWNARNPERAYISKQATDKVIKAIRRGLLSRPTVCEACGASSDRIEAAHYDYSEPLSVKWLCRSCHVTWDQAEPKTLHLSRSKPGDTPN